MIKQYCFCLVFLFTFVYATAQPINRKQLVERHTIINTSFDSLSSLTVGNGGFAFTVDATGLQSFPDWYAGGVPLGTQSQWGWHSFINKENYSFYETLKYYKLNGKNVSYSVQVKEPERSKNAVDWFRQNPHRLQLGNIGFEFTKKDGGAVAIDDIRNIRQTLNMWTGEIRSHFTIENIPVDVLTYCHQLDDAISVRINSELVSTGRLQIRFRFPFPTGEWKDVGNNWKNPDQHQSVLQQVSPNSGVLTHVLDTTRYSLAVTWNGAAKLEEKGAHYFLLTPSGSNQFEFMGRFSSNNITTPVPSFLQTKSSNEISWKKFWQTGGAIDFTGSKDERAKELERRIILSQYLTKVQCAGIYPPQETGLTYNSWYGKPHLEMHWWHGIHFALWGRTSLLEKSMQWYADVYGEANKLAMRQGYEGVRWQKMTDPWGKESPSSVGAFLIWQQPHIIYFLELIYREKKDRATLNYYKDLVFATADFMASFPYYDSLKQRYVLGKGVIPAQERFKAEETFNPTYELVYWYWALNVAQQWRQRLGMKKDKYWEDVLTKLSALPTESNKYLFTESGTDSYTNPEYKTDHPSVLGALGMLPKTTMLDTVIMKNTFDWIWNNWSWNDTWGWDFPMTAMTATRLGLPAKAVDALLMPIQTNTYLNNGHNYQDGRLTIYLPGNGGLLAAVAMMCAGYEGSKGINPGFPKNGKWKVKWEGLKKML